MIKRGTRAIARRARLVLGRNPVEHANYKDTRESVLSMFQRNGVGAEIGVFRGSYSEKIIRNVAPTKLYLIDPWVNFDDSELEQSWYSSKSSNDMNEIHREVCQKFKKEIEAGQVTILKSKTEDCNHEIPDGSLDFIYVDGDHRFEGVSFDLKFAFKKVRKGGLIAIDDHALGSWWGDGVVRATNAFLGMHPGDLIVELVLNTQVVIRKL